MTLRTGRGLTLIEVLVSVVILAMGAVTILQALAKVAHAQVLAASQVGAYVVALSKLGDLELAFREGQDVDDSDSGSMRLGQQAFQWRTVVMPVLDDDPLVRLVRVGVAWRVGGDTFERRVETWLRLAAPLKN